MKFIEKLTNWPPKRERVGRWVLFALSLPIALGWLFPLLMCLIGAGRWKKLRFEPTLVLTTEWRDWSAKIWGFSTTLGRGIMYKASAKDDTKEPSTRIEKHEHIHVRQFEDASVMGLCLGLVSLAAPTVSEWFWVWAMTPAFLATQWVTAWARGWNPYRASQMELSAYGLTNKILEGDVGRTWEDILLEESGSKKKLDPPKD